MILWSWNDVILQDYNILTLQGRNITMPQHNKTITCPYREPNSPLLVFLKILLYTMSNVLSEHGYNPEPSLQRCMPYKCVYFSGSKVFPDLICIESTRHFMRQNKGLPPKAQHNIRNPQLSDNIGNSWLSNKIRNPQISSNF